MPSLPSEVAPVLGETQGGVKTTQKNPKILPEVVIYDVDLTVDLPAPVAVTSGMNAIAHAVEALYAKDGNPVASLMAEEGIGALARALPQLAEGPAQFEPRSEALYGAWLCGQVLGMVGMALHHKLCHVLGGAFDLPHAQTHSVATGENRTQPQWLPAQSNGSIPRRASASSNRMGAEPTSSSIFR